MIVEIHVSEKDAEIGNNNWDIGESLVLEPVGNTEG